MTGRLHIGRGVHVVRQPRIEHDGRTLNVAGRPVLALPASLNRSSVSASNAGPSAAVITASRDLAEVNIGVRLPPDLTPVLLPDPSAEVWLSAIDTTLTTIAGQPITAVNGQPIEVPGTGLVQLFTVTVNIDWKD